MAKREYIPEVSLPKPTPSAGSKAPRTAEEKRVDEARRMQARAIAIDTKNRIKDIWQAYGNEARAEFLQAKEQNPDSMSAVERKVLEDVVAKWGREAQEKRVGVDLRAVAQAVDDPRLARFAATERLQQDLLDEDFVKNTSRDVLARFVAEEMDKAGRAYSSETRSTRAGGTSPLKPAETSVVKKRSLSEAEVAELQKRRDELARLEELANLNREILELEDRGNADPADLIRGRDRLKSLAQSYGLTIPSPDRVGTLKLKIAMLDRQIKKKAIGGFKLGGGDGEKGAPSDFALRQSMALRQAIARDQKKEFIKSLMDTFTEQNPDASEEELRRKLRQFYKEYDLTVESGGRISTSRATAAGRVARGAAFAQQYENEILRRAADVAKSRVGVAWDELSESDKQVAVEKEAQAIEKTVRGEKIFGQREIRDASGKVIGTETIWGTPADLDTVRKTYAKRPTIYIYTSVKGGMSVRRPNPTFVDVATGELKPNPAYVKAVAEGQPTAGIPKTLFAMAEKTWEASRADLQEAPYAERVLIDPKDPSKGYVPDSIRVAGQLLSMDTPEGKQAKYAKTLRASFYATGRAIDPTNKVITEARRRVKDEARALGLAVGQKGTKEEKAFAKEWVESRVPLMIGSILAEPGQFTLKDMALAKLLADSIKNKELIVTKSQLAEIEGSMPEEPSGRRKVETVKAKISEAAALRRAARNAYLEYEARAISAVGKPPSLASYIKDPRAAAEYARLREMLAEDPKTAKKKLKAFYKKTPIDPGYRSAMAEYQRRINQYLADTKSQQEQMIRDEYLAILRGERGAREGLRIRKAEKPLGALAGWADDIGGTLTLAAVGGLVVFGLFKAMSRKSTPPTAADLERKAIQQAVAETKSKVAGLYRR